MLGKRKHICRSMWALGCRSVTPDLGSPSLMADHGPGQTLCRDARVNSWWTHIGLQSRWRRLLIHAKVMWHWPFTKPTPNNFINIILNLYNNLVVSILQIKRLRPREGKSWLETTDPVNGRAWIYILAPESMLLIRELDSISQDLLMHNTGQTVASSARMKWWWSPGRILLLY